jgi:subtilisin family serine protease
VLVGLVAFVAAVAAPAAVGSNYVVLYKQQAVPANVAATIAQAGGRLVYAYPQIGVAIASSDNAWFRSKIMEDARVENASSTDGFASKLPDTETAAADDGDLPNAPATDTDTLTPLQWDMRQIHTPEAHAVTGGSPTVLVGDIDTGLDYRHPDLAANVDDAASVNCVTGAPVPGMVAADDDNGHGTHTAGTIAAASNGIGIVGVAPNVRIAGIKAGNAAGFFFPEAVICAFYWVATHGIDVTNNSYFADPYLYNCRNDPTQRALWKAESRAIRFAMDNGVTVVAAAGNESDDLAHPTQDVTSPDDTDPVTRDITNACTEVPTELPGVITVSADGSLPQENGGFLKAFYSNYGSGVIAVTAPGGDSVYRTPESVNGRILSTWPATIPCGRRALDPASPGTVWCYLQGTSMASPHVAGVAALVISRYGSLAGPGDATMRTGQVAQYVQQTADPQACPSFLPTAPIDYAELGASVSNGAPPVCTGGTGYNSWYGHGQVNAFRAVTNDRSQSG